MVRQRWPKSKSNLGFQFQSSIFEAKTLSTVTGCQVTTQIFTLGVILGQKFEKKFWYENSIKIIIMILV